MSTLENLMSPLTELNDFPLNTARMLQLKNMLRGLQISHKDTSPAYVIHDIINNLYRAGLEIEGDEHQRVNDVAQIANDISNDTNREEKYRTLKVLTHRIASLYDISDNQIYQARLTEALAMTLLSQEKYRVMEQKEQSTAIMQVEEHKRPVHGKFSTNAVLKSIHARQGASLSDRFN